LQIKDNKRAYFNALAKAREGRTKSYYQFMLEQTKKTYEFLPEAMIKYKISAPRIWQIIKRQKDKIKK